MTDLRNFENEIIPNATFRESILDFEKRIENTNGAYIGDSVICPLKHTFSEGIYVREIFIPKGTVLTGKIHKHAHPNFLMSGKVDVVTEGEGHQRLAGPCSIMSPPGTKRALQAITDLVWITVHHNPTNTQDLAELEKIVIADSYEDYEVFVGLKQKLADKQEFDKEVLAYQEEVTAPSFLNRIINKLIGGNK